MASLGNILDNPHIGMIFLDFNRERIGLHVDGTTQIVGAEDRSGRPRVERWVEVRVQEAYIHCRKHLPHLVNADGNGRAWGTDDSRAKGGDYFGASCEPRPWSPNPRIPRRSQPPAAVLAPRPGPPAGLGLGSQGPEAFAAGARPPGRTPRW